MPCNFKSELTKVVNSNEALQSIHQKYLMASARIILKMDSSKHKYNSDGYLTEYLAMSRVLINDFTLAEKLLILLMELDKQELYKIFAECGNIDYVLVAILDRKFLH